MQHEKSCNFSRILEDVVGAVKSAEGIKFVRPRHGDSCNSDYSANGLPELMSSVSQMTKVIEPPKYVAVTTS